ncbi:MAG TPA: histidine kinase [Propionibacteriaceae bacterium]|nr:histidine kinase [Propionibacteriaceae bacterium]
MPLFWRLFLANAATLAIAFALLAAGAPDTLSAHGLGTLILGAAALMLVNAAVIGQSLSGLTELRQALAANDQAAPMPPGIASEVDDLADAYDGLRQRLVAERNRTARAALRAQEEERRALARDLHDGVGQNLTFLLLRLKGVAEQAPPELADDLAAVADATRQTLDQVRALSRHLRPGVLEDLGLRPALTALVEDLRGLGLDATLDCPTGLARDAARDLVVYRVVQEALTNVVRHAGASSVRVAVVVEGESMEVTVSDDGNGLPGNEGTGTGSMRERVRLAGGSFDRTATPGRGTEVRIEVPLQVDDDGSSPAHPIPTLSLVPLTAAQLRTGA